MYIELGVLILRRYGNAFVCGYFWFMKQPHRLETDHHANDSNSSTLARLDKFPRIAHTEKIIKSWVYTEYFSDRSADFHGFYRNYYDILYGDRQPSTGISAF